MGFRSITAVAAAAFNQLSSSSTITSSVSSSNLPTLGNAGSSVRAGYSHRSAVPASTSLQDLTSYRKINIEEDSTVGSSEDLHQSKPPAYRVQSDETTYTSKSSKSADAWPGLVSGLRRPKCWCKVVGVMAFTFIFVILIYLGFQWWRLHWRSENLQYAIVLDCGSTGTRVQVYAWAYRDSSGPDQSPVAYPTFQLSSGFLSGRKAGQKKETRAYNRMETEPGLDKLLKNESGVRTAVEPLLQWAEKQIPPSAHKRTPLFLLATAGLRRLAHSDAEWLLDKAWSVLERSPFLCKRSWVKVISGVEEAYYGWVALNYKFGKLGQMPQQPTYGVLDLGGSSLQVTFESQEVDHNEYALNLSVGSAVYHLYAYSHAGFGLNDAFDRSVGLLWSRLLNISNVATRTLEVRHPCLHRGYQAQYKCARCSLQSSAEVRNGGRGEGTKKDLYTEITLIGKPDWQSCKVLADTVVNVSRLSGSSNELDCVEPPCALGAHQPAPHGQFFALSGFFVVYKFFGLPFDASFENLLSKGKDYCAKPWKEAHDSVVPQPLVEHYCFRAPYVIALLQQGLHLKENQITVGSGDMTWTLGAALLEAGAFVPSHIRGAAPGKRRFQYTGDPHLLNTGTLTVVLLVMMMMVLFVATYFLNCISLPFRKPHVSLFTQPSLGSSTWLPSNLISPIRLGFRKVDNAIRNGDGRLKMPHSPAPLGTPQDYSQLRFSSSLASVGNPMLESTGLQLPAVSGPYASKKSQLSSRRTPSKDDLSLFFRDGHGAIV